MATGFTYPARGGATEILHAAKCDLIWRDFDTLYDSMAFWQANGTEVNFDNTGVRLGGSWDKDTPPDSLWTFRTTNLENLIPTPDHHMMVAECVKKTEGGNWHTQRVGPFKSTGGYDWWTYFHRDFTPAREELEGLKAGERIGFTGHMMGPVDKNWNLIPIPPIHDHHIHIVPGLGAYHTTQEFWTLAPCFLFGEWCFDASMAIQQHGDLQCMPEEGGADCFGRDYSTEGGGGFIKLIRESLAITGQCNDLRPKASPPMVWWYQTTFRLTTIREHSKWEALSTSTISNPASGALPMENPFTMIVPTGEDSLIYFTGRHAFSGTLVGIDLHTHQLKSQGTLLIAATPQELGLDSPLFKTIHPWRAILTKETGFGSNQVLREHVLRSLTESQGSLDSIVCKMHGNSENVNGMGLVDRMTSYVDCHTWPFTSGQQFSVVAFNGPPTHVRDKFTKVGEFAGMAGITDTGDFPQHIALFAYYTATDGLSHYTSNMYTQSIDTVSSAMSRLDWIRTYVLDGGSPDHKPALSTYTRYAVFLSVLYCTDFSSRIPMAAFAIAAVILAGLCYLGCSAGWRALLVGVVTTAYWIVLVIYTVLISQHQYIANKFDNAILSARDASDKETIANRVALYTVGLCLIAVTARLMSVDKKVSAKETSSQLI